MKGLIEIYVATHISGKNFDLQLYDGEFSPGMQNRGSAFVTSILKYLKL